MTDFMDAYERVEDIDLPACLSCRFWSSMEASTNDKEYRHLGTCLRRAPSPQPSKLVGDGFVKFNWPITHIHEWCGEHSERETPLVWK